MKLHTITATTPEGAKLFAVVDPMAQPGMRGALSYSETLAALAPFPREADAVAAFDKAKAKIL